MRPSVNGHLHCKKGVQQYIESWAENTELQINVRRYGSFSLFPRTFHKYLPG